MARIGTSILLTKSEWSELVLVFFGCPKVDNAQPCFGPTMIFLKCQSINIVFKLNELTFQISGRSRFGGPARSQASAHLTNHPIYLKRLPLSIYITQEQLFKF